MALNPFHYLWGEISQSFSRSPDQALCCCCCVYMCLRVCVCISGCTRKLDGKTHTYLVLTAPLLGGPPGYVCVRCCLVVSQQCLGLLCVSQVHSQGN